MPPLAHHRSRGNHRERSLTPCYIAPCRTGVGVPSTAFRWRYNFASHIMFPNGHQEITSCGSLTRFCAPGLHLLDCLEHISSDSKGSARCLCYHLPSQLWATVHGASFSPNPLSAPGSVRLLAPAIAE